ncbi:hypothetical protein LINPERHAP2_LOCUS12909 [Linum perenne]
MLADHEACRRFWAHNGLEAMPFSAIDQDDGSVQIPEVRLPLQAAELWGFFEMDDPCPPLALQQFIFTFKATNNRVSFSFSEFERDFSWNEFVVWLGLYTKEEARASEKHWPNVHPFIEDNLLDERNRNALWRYSTTRVPNVHRLNTLSFDYAQAVYHGIHLDPHTGAFRPTGDGEDTLINKDSWLPNLSSMWLLIGVGPFEKVAKWIQDSPKRWDTYTISLYCNHEQVEAIRQVPIGPIGMEDE